MLRDSIPFDSLATMYHDRTEERLAENLPREGLPEPYQQPLSGVQAGDIIGPVELDRGNGRTLYAAIIFLEERPEGPSEFEDLRDQLRQALAEENSIRRYVQTLREATYVDIRIGGL